MKSKYIQSLLSELQYLESKVVGLKENQTVSFSFFKEAFKHTQEITRLLHNLEFVQIEDMKSQMEKLVQFLSQTSDQTESFDDLRGENYKNNVPDKVEIDISQEKEETISPLEIYSSSKNLSALEIKEDYPQLNKSESKGGEYSEEILRENSMFQDRKPHEEVPSPSKKIPRVEIKEDYPQFEDEVRNKTTTKYQAEKNNADNLIEEKEIPSSDIPATAEALLKVEIKEDFPLQEKEAFEDTSHKSSLSPKIIDKHDFIKEGATNDSKMPPVIPTTKSLNDVQPTNHTILDTKRSISLNDRFLFQRELFNNDRYAMNNMMIKMQAFTTFAESKDYLENNTDWDFKDETVEKFLDLIKEGF